MCGIFGWIKPSARFETDLDLSRIFRDGLIQTQSRGEDATGFYTVGTGIIKTTQKAEDFVASGNVPDISNERFVFGHCRQASKKYQNDPSNLGDPVNAQPYESANWIMIHNGTVDIPSLKGYKYSGKTDSEVIISYVEKTGLRNALASIDGSATVVLYDKKNQKIYFWTNGERPLVITYYQGMIYFASTRKILRQTLYYEDIMGIFPVPNFAVVYEMEPIVFDLKRNRFSRQLIIEKKIIKKKSVPQYQAFTPIADQISRKLSKGCGPSCPPSTKMITYNGNGGKVVRIGK